MDKKGLVFQVFSVAVGIAICCVAQTTEGQPSPSSRSEVTVAARRGEEREVGRPQRGVWPAIVRLLRTVGLSDDIVFPKP